ncbi:MAG: hypothetical protein NTV34_16280, partial [Proteobacteria bacterium]|nr:hypothetical protein [Pseudomonadota bacterium]
ARSRSVISERPLLDGARGGEGTAVQIREIETDRPKREFYVKNKDLKVKQTRKKNNSGSLSAVDDGRSYVLPTELPVAVGTNFDIKVSSNRLEPPGSAADAAPTPDPKSAAQLEETLLKSLPNLEPGANAKDGPVVVKSFKVQVIDLRDNGDVVVAYHRRSLRADHAGDLLINAVIPFSALANRDGIFTDKLQDVHIRESQDGEIAERSSSNWEDEYTLRISGFDEAKSKSALALDERRKQLQEAKDRVVAQIKSLGSERQTMTKERQDLLDNKKKDEEKIASLEEKVKDQESEIQKLTPKVDEADDSENASEGKDSDKSKQSGTKDKTSKDGKGQLKDSKALAKESKSSPKDAKKSASKDDKKDEESDNVKKPAAESPKKPAGGSKK